jgi:hypothetical protein
VSSHASPGGLQDLPEPHPTFYSPRLTGGFFLLKISLSVRQIWELVEKVLARADLKKDGQVEGAEGAVRESSATRHTRTLSSAAPKAVPSEVPGGASSSSSPGVAGPTPAPAPAASSRSQRSASIPPPPSRTALSPLDSPREGAANPSLGTAGKRSRRMPKVSKDGGEGDAGAGGPSPCGPDLVPGSSAGKNKRAKLESKVTGGVALDSIPEAPQETVPEAPKASKARALGSPRRRVEDAGKESPRQSKAAAKRGVKDATHPVLPPGDGASDAADAPQIEGLPLPPGSRYEAVAVPPGQPGRIAPAEQVVSPSANVSDSAAPKGRLHKAHPSATEPKATATATAGAGRGVRGGKVGIEKVVAVEPEASTADAASLPPSAPVGRKRAPLVITIKKGQKAAKAGSAGRAVTSSSAEAVPGSGAVLGSGAGPSSDVVLVEGAVSSPPTGPGRGGRPGKKPSSIKGKRPPVAPMPVDAAAEGDGAGAGGGDGSQYPIRQMHDHSSTSLVLGPTLCRIVSCS